MTSKDSKISITGNLIFLLQIKWAYLAQREASLQKDIEQVTSCLLLLAYPHTEDHSIYSVLFLRMK